MKSDYWLWQAQQSFAWSKIEPGMRWEQFAYYYLFRAAGYDGGL